MSSIIDRIGTRDVLAVMTVAAALIFNGISLVTGSGPDAATMTLAGAVVGYYFKDSGSAIRDIARGDEPLGDPDLGDRA